MTGHLRRTRLVALALTTVALAVTSAVAAPPAAAAPATVDIPVSFTVTNVNRSGVPCSPDGARHTIRGHLVAPRSVLADSPAHAVTIYLHTLGAAEWIWRFRGAPRLDYTAAMAGAGFASLSIDRLGYGASDRPPGLAVCIGADADILNQIVNALRTGNYRAGSKPGPRFGKVVAAGASVGGMIAEVAAYSFKNLDGLIQLGYADGGTNIEAGDIGSLPQIGRDCALSGYAHNSPTARMRRAFYGVPAPVTEAALARASRDPCGDIASTVPATVVDLHRIGEIKIPVLAVYGRQDSTVRAGAGEQQLARFTGSTDVTGRFLDKTGHFFMLAGTAPQFRTIMSHWLTTRGFKG